MSMVYFFCWLLSSDVLRISNLLDKSSNVPFLKLTHSPSFLYLKVGWVKAELSVVHELAHRRDRLRGDLHQVQTALLSDAQRLVGGHDAQLLAGIADQADLFVVDLFVQLMHDLANAKAPPIKIKTRMHLASAQRQKPAVSFLSRC